MIVLDTNVLSELMRRRPTPEVITWLDEQPSEEICITAVIEAEILYGIACMPTGQKQQRFRLAAEQLFETLLAGRVLPFDRAAAKLYANLASTRRRAGKPISQADAQIAAIAKVHGCAIATRNVIDFLNCGIELINPWEKKSI